MNTLLNSLQDLMSSHALQRVSSIFGLIEVAEEELARAEGEVPFWLMFPPEGFNEVAHWMFRSHCRELCARFLAGEPLEPGTLAECCLTMSRTSLATPLNAQGRAIYAHVAVAAMELVEDSMPEASSDFIRELASDDLEPWPGSNADMLYTLRRKTSRPRRTDAPEG